MDRVLVERAMAGDHEAFSELTRLSITKLYREAAQSRRRLQVESSVRPIAVFRSLFCFSFSLLSLLS